MIVHITTPQEWQSAVADGAYSADSLATEGFIHCSTPAQVLIPANERYPGRTDLCLLVIDPGALENELIYEDCYETGQEFPHVYGTINPSAVTKTVPFPCNPDGTFNLPAELDS